MWKSVKRSRGVLRARRGDVGFSLIEMTVALSLFAIAAAGMIPLVVGSMRASVVAKYSSQAKNLAQQQLEYMRSLPFHVAHQNGLGYVDLLDVHFRDRSAVSTNIRCPGGAGYTAATSTYKCNSGTLAAPYSLFSISTDSQFLDFNRTVVVPPSAYNSQTVGSDQPPTGLLGVTVTVSWSQYGANKTFSLYSQIATHSPTAPVVVQQSKVSAVRVLSSVRDVVGAESALRLEAGVVNASGSVEKGSEASATVQGAEATLGDVLPVRGATVVFAAPPTTTGVSSTIASGVLGSLPCGYACFGSTTVAGDLKAEITGGNPTVGGTGVAPSGGSSATLTEPQHNQYAFKFFNDASDPSGLNLMIAEPMVFMSGYPGGPTQTAQGSGFLKATNSTTVHTVTTNGYATTTEIDILPTSKTPVINGRKGGVVRVRLDSAVLGCTTNGTAGTFPGTTWSGAVQYFDVAANSYSAWIGVGPTAGADPLAAVPLSSISEGTSPDGRALTLADYVESWASLTATNIESSNNAARASLPGVISVVTKPTRGLIAAPTTVDPTSAIRVTLGDLSCLAEDNR